MIKNKNFNNLKVIPEEELNSIFRQGALLRMPYLESRYLQAKQNVRNYEKKYGIKLEKLISKGLPDDAGYEMHEDFIEGEYWNDVMNDTGYIMKQLKKILRGTQEANVEY